MGETFRQPRLVLYLLATMQVVVAIGMAPDAATAQDPPRRAVPRRTVPQPARQAPYVNLSELQFRPNRPVGVFEEEPNPRSDATPSPATFPPSGRRLLRAMTPGSLWNTEAGRRSLGERVVLAEAIGRGARAGVAARGPGRVTARDAEVEGKLVCVEPTLTKSGSKCCSYTIPDELAGMPVTYRQPLHVFGDEQGARDFAASVRASMPMFVPYQDPDVYAAHGWIYNGGNFHGAVDYLKTSDAYGPGIDPSFRVHAIADGRVVSVVWDDWSGNIVVVEHTAPNGDRYRSAYKHMRNGFSNDLANARAISVSEDDAYKADGVTPTNWLKYQRFADLDDPSEQHWGTESQTIAVSVGDLVTAGEFLGWSGNTGAGGAGNGLNDDGTPKNVDTANNHLHFMMAVPDPTPGSSDWVQVDPYGVYETVSGSGCYDLLDPTAYVRLFAPFYPSFHNVPAEYVGAYWGYYTGMGMALQTLSLHRRGGDVLASGAFQGGLPGAWYARAYMTAADYQEWFDTYKQQGFRPREIAVTKDGSGAPRFTVIWKKGSGEAFAAHHNLTDADWTAKWQEYVVNGPYRVEDRTAYEVGGTRRWTGVFVADGDKAFYELHYMPSDTFNSRAKTYADQGFGLWSVDPEELSGGIRYGAIWRKLPGAWVARHGLSPSEYQAEFEKWSGQGYRLHRVRGYANSERFAAVWIKP